MARTIALDSPRAAQKVKDEIIHQIGLLEDFPELEPLSRDEGLRHDGYRILVVGNYLVFYQVLGEEVQVKRVLHGARKHRHLLPE
ncbi:MAG: type II toxin-antitoxin system RelE/ParE family toxin [Chitinophagales bacterium]